MATYTKTMSKDEILQLKNRLQSFILKESKPQYTYYQIKTNECTITAYTSGKVVFQGANLDWLIPEQKHIEELDQAGSDEVGTGDYFGPVVVCACIVSKEARFKLKNLGIQDSKQINDDKIRLLAPKIKEVCPHSILIVSNEKYNQVHPTTNMVDMKCKLHNQAYVNLLHAGYKLPKQVVIDQFVQEKSYYKYLSNTKEVVQGITIETKAENKYLAVACASILARNAFLETWDKMEEAYQFTFEKGAGSKVDACGKEFVKKFGQKKLYAVAKLHFKNTSKIISES